ncbi:hypothetical protein B0A49_02241 [Cryomyces minteri]|uniref:FAD-binding FR-type domain-containing protein n=1 Tax=Cryomyces minteri TaxID=331657 RepID=A0A4V5NJL0_9PEZI|nr:hypothetical protein B0A49_02241 [Cryomyces minteri]
MENKDSSRRKEGGDDFSPNISIRKLRRYNVIVIACSTTGQGEMPLNARGFWASIRSSQLKVRNASSITDESNTTDSELAEWRPDDATPNTGFLKSVYFTTFGLGDSSYPKYNHAAIKLHNRFVRLGANPICDRGEGDEQHPDGLYGTFPLWSRHFEEDLLRLFPLENGREPLAEEDVPFRPKWRLVPEEQTDDSDDSRTATPTLNGAGAHSFYGSEQCMPPLANGDDGPAGSAVPLNDSVWMRNTQRATLLEHNRVTPVQHNQDVRLLKFRVDDTIEYSPGATMTIYPKNLSGDVNAFMDLMDWRSIADRRLQFASQDPAPRSRAYLPPPLQQLAGPDGSVHPGWFTLRSLLTSHLDFMSIPRRSFFATAAYFTDNEDEKAKLRTFGLSTDVDDLQDYYDYTTRPRRTIFEVMEDFRSLHVPWQYITSLIPFIRGRQFSIASGGQLKHEPSGATLFDLIVAIVDSPSVILKDKEGKPKRRYGVCTKYVTTLAPGSSLAVKIDRGFLHVPKRGALTTGTPNSAVTIARDPDLKPAVLMVGTGTGIAPLRSLIHERLALRTNMTCALQSDILFFGCRKEDADYYFKDEWKTLAVEQGLAVFPAFSAEDNLKKTYVQHLIVQQADLVFRTLHDEGGWVFVCGSSGNMPKGVRAALVEVFETRDGWDLEKAEAFVKALEQDQRYKQETW